LCDCCALGSSVLRGVCKQSLLLLPSTHPTPDSLVHSPQQPSTHRSMLHHHARLAGAPRAQAARQLTPPRCRHHHPSVVCRAAPEQEQPLPPPTTPDAAAAPQSLSQQQQQQQGSMLQIAVRDPPTWSAFAGTLVQQGALLGPIFDGIHSRTGLQVGSSLGGGARIHEQGCRWALVQQGALLGPIFDGIHSRTGLQVGALCKQGIACGRRQPGSSGLEGGVRMHAAGGERQPLLVPATAGSTLCRQQVRHLFVPVPAPSCLHHRAH
jgi:hypothetical protein